MNPITLLAAQEHQRELRAVAPRRRNLGIDQDQTPITRVTLRYAAAADSERLRRLAELDSGQAPSGSALIAEVDGRLRAALPLDGGPPLADPFHRGAELIALLQLRACQLTR
jgi:hypothetical protein